MSMNDKTVEGICYEGKNTFTLQFHPEAHAGPRDSAYLIDEFIKMMGEA